MDEEKEKMSNEWWVVQERVKRKCWKGGFGNVGEVERRR